MRAFAGPSPRQVYTDLADLVGLGDGSELDRYYAYVVLSRVDDTKLVDDARAYVR